MEVVIDTNVFLNVKNREEPFYSYSEQLLNSIDEGRNKAVLPTIVVAEVCCGYYLTGEIEDKVRGFRQLFLFESKIWSSTEGRWTKSRE